MQEPPGLREYLRAGTSELHDALDAMMTPLALREDLGPFLQIQLQARVPLEQWLNTVNIAPNMATPPHQTPLITRDLEALGYRPTGATHEAWDGEPEQAVGIAWLVAGSSLGNRSILAQRRKRGLVGGESFLADAAMRQYWDRLKPRLAQIPADFTAASALAGARRGFAHFLACVVQECDAAAA